MDSLLWVVVEAALGLYQSLEVHLLNRKLLVGLCLLLEGLSCGLAASLEPCKDHSAGERREHPEEPAWMKSPSEVDQME